MIATNKNITLVLAEPEESELMLKVALENPEPKGVKMSRKNQAMITILPEDYEDDAHVQT